MLSIVHTHARGRCLIASEHIQAGSDVIVEDPFVSVAFETGVESNISLAHRLYEKCCIGQTEREAFLNLCAPCKSRISTEHIEKLRKLTRANSGNLGHGLEFSEIFSRMNYNAFTIQDNEMMAIGVGVYIQAAMINHSCDPNCVQTFVKNKLYIRTIRDIQKGEEITITYIGKKAFSYRSKFRIIKALVAVLKRYAFSHHSKQT